MSSRAELIPAPRASGELLAAGEVLDARYRIVHALGRGGAGQVYEALDLRLGRRVAVKVLSAAHSAEARRRFEREARAVAQIQHENVVVVFDFGCTSGGQPYLILQYLSGKDLRQLLREERQLAAPRAVRLLHDACLGLAAAHESGVIHRDLKPENLFVSSRNDGSEKCTVLDFGLAKSRLPDSSDLRTMAGVPFGTLHYMSPEQARGDVSIDERTDVYGSAAVLYELLCGERVHNADSPHALLHKITHEAPLRLERRGAFLPSGLAEVVHRALSPDRVARPPNIVAFAELLEPFAAGRGRSTRSPARPTERVTDDTQPEITNARVAVVRASRKRPRTAWLWVSMALVGGLGAWLALNRSRFVASETKITARPTASESLPERTPAALTIAVSSPSRPAPVATREGSPATPPSSFPPTPVANGRDSNRLRGQALAVPVSSSNFDRQNPYED